MVISSAFGTSGPVYGTPQQADQVGVLIIAHGGSKRWDRSVRHAVGQAQLALPTEVAFGMGMHPEEVQQLQAAVERLERRGVTHVVAIPLLISSHSEVFRQYAYLLGLHQTAQWPQAGAPLRHQAAIEMGPALDDDPVVGEILLERARELSRAPGRETVVLVAHGPNEELDNHLWMETMQRLAQRLKREGGFLDVESCTLRDDAPAPVHQQAVEQLRHTVEAAGRRGAVLVVPLLMAQSGVEKKIPGLLSGLSYRFRGHTLLPHPKIAEWIARQTAQLAGSSKDVGRELARSEGSAVVLK